MTDITERLRTRGGRPDGFGLGPICDEAAAEIDRLRAQVATYRLELERVNNEFGSQTADWPDAWQRVADVKQIAGRNWRENEELRAQVAEMREDVARWARLLESMPGDGQPSRMHTEMPVISVPFRPGESYTRAGFIAAIDRARKSGGQG